MTRVLAGMLILVSLLSLWQWREVAAADGRTLAMKAERDRARGERDAAVLAHATERENRAIEAGRVNRLQEALNDEHKKRLAVEADARSADAAAVSLRARVRSLAAAARCPAASPVAASSGPPADAPGDLLAELFERLDERAGELARYADQARLAGQLCERAYGALTSGGPANTPGAGQRDHVLDDRVVDEERVDPLP